MSKESQLLDIVAEILELEVNEISFETKLDDSNWDSLAVVSFIAEVDSEFGKILSPKDVSSAENIKSLLDLI